MMMGELGWFGETSPSTHPSAGLSSGEESWGTHTLILLYPSLRWKQHRTPQDLPLVGNVFHFRHSCWV